MTNNKTITKLLKLASLFEIATGLALMAFPSFAVLLILNSELVGSGIAIGRIAGLGLFSLGVACWPSGQVGNQPLRAMLAYGVVVTIYLTYLGIDGQWVGWLLWPAVFFHSVITFLLMRYK